MLRCVVGVFTMLVAMEALATSLVLSASSISLAPGDPLEITVFGDSEGKNRPFMTVYLDFGNPGGTGTLTANWPAFVGTLNTSFLVPWNPTGSSGYCGSLVPSYAQTTNTQGAMDGSCIVVDAWNTLGLEASGDLLPSTLGKWTFDTSKASVGDVFQFQARDPGDRGTWGSRDPEADYWMFYDEPPSNIVSVTFVPEPSTALLMSLGFLGLAAARRR